MNTEKIIKEYLQEMAEQDNCGTGAPYFYTIRWHESFEELLCVPKDSDTWEELSDRDEIENKELKRLLSNRGPTEVIEKKTGVFFTRKEAEAHLRLNHYHYPKDAHVYCDHAWRAPYMARFLVALLVHFKIDCDKGSQGYQHLRQWKELNEICKN